MDVTKKSLINIVRFKIIVTVLSITFLSSKLSIVLFFNHLAPVSFFDNKKNDLNAVTFEKIIHTVEEYPTVSEVEFRENLKHIEYILKNIDHSVIFMFDIDDTLITKGESKIKYVKELLYLLHKSDHLVGIVTHRMLMPETLDPNNMAAIKESDGYKEIESNMASLGVNLDHFDFFSAGAMMKDFKLYNYFRIRNQQDASQFIERTKIIDDNQKTAKIVSLSHIDHIMQEEFNTHHFEGSSLINIDDDGLAGHSMLSTKPITASHQKNIDKFTDTLKDFLPLQNTLKRIKTFAGIIIPSYRDGTLQFTNVLNAKKFQYNQAEEAKLFFDLSSAILKQLKNISTPDRSRHIPQEIASIAVADQTTRSFIKKNTAKFLLDEAA